MGLITKHFTQEINPTTVGLLSVAAPLYLDTGKFTSTLQSCPLQSKSQTLNLCLFSDLLRYLKFIQALEVSLHYRSRVKLQINNVLPSILNIYQFI